ncbi:MAG: dipeptidyl aminopeptidase/acylaminoacyl peptidase [Candidatus Azotimanducaceae bacterium]|jgi:dipeptidyl aminopeptidase/acylaminoacyl peptidase
MNYRAITLCLLLTTTFAHADEQAVIKRTLNNGNLILEDIPDIPRSIITSLEQYQNVRSASFQSWDETGTSIYIRTRFGDVTQLHRVDSPGGMRTQLTFFEEPIGGVSRQPGGSDLVFTMDAGGSEVSQIFVLDPAAGTSRMISDGESRNNNVTWRNDGGAVAYTSTARNGRSNDVWMVEPKSPESRQLVHESNDGTLWAATDFSDNGEHIMLLNYVSAVNSSIHVKNMKNGDVIQLAGGGEKSSVNYPVGFDADNQGAFLITDRGGEFRQLVWVPLDEPTKVKTITTGINWDVVDVELSEDGKRGAFVTNTGGISALYLLDTRTHRYKRVDNIPTGVIGRISFSPDSRKLALTINTPKTPSDTFVLSLGRSALASSDLTRWTYSEVGGLDTTKFIEPELIEFKTFDDRTIPAFYYKPAGEGPFPVVISIHGGPEGQARPLFSSTYQMWLATLGVAVLVPNVRGSSGYGREYIQLDNGFKREDSVKDVGALLDWIEGNEALDSNRVAVFGGSYGGYMVLASAVHYSDRLKAGVNIVGVSNFVTFLENTQSYRRDLRRVEYGDERNPAMRAFLSKISPLSSTDKIKIPLFVVQGENDPRVPVTEAEQIVQALRSKDQKVWYMNALNEGHGYARKENRDVYRQATVMFLKQFLIKEE